MTQIYLKGSWRAKWHVDEPDMSPFIANLLAMSYEAKGDATNARQYYRRTLEPNAHSPQNAFCAAACEEQAQAVVTFDKPGMTFHEKSE